MGSANDGHCSPGLALVAPVLTQIQIAFLTLPDITQAAATC